MKVFAFAASLRKDSINRRLLLLAEDIVRECGHEVDHAEFSEFDMPLYNGDLQDESGIPAGAEALGARISESDAWLLASPEYNWGAPGRSRTRSTGCRACSRCRSTASRHC